MGLCASTKDTDGAHVSKHARSDSGPSLGSRPISQIPALTESATSLPCQDEPAPSGAPKANTDDENDFKDHFDLAQNAIDEELGQLDEPPPLNTQSSFSFNFSRGPSLHGSSFGSTLSRNTTAFNNLQNDIDNEFLPFHERTLSAASSLPGMDTVMRSDSFAASSPIGITPTPTPKRSSSKDHHQLFQFTRTGTERGSLRDLKTRQAESRSVSVSYSNTLQAADDDDHVGDVDDSVREDRLPSVLHAAPAEPSHPAVDDGNSTDSTSEEEYPRQPSPTATTNGLDTSSDPNSSSTSGPTERSSGSHSGASDGSKPGRKVRKKRTVSKARPNSTDPRTKPKKKKKKKEKKQSKPPHSKTAPSARLHSDSPANASKVMQLLETPQKKRGVSKSQSPPKRRGKKVTTAKPPRSAGTSPEKSKAKKNKKKKKKRPSVSASSG